MNYAASNSRDRTAVDISLLLVRVIGGILIGAHGAQKMFPIWGGVGMTAMAEQIGMGIVGYLVIIGEFFGGLGLIFGFLSRFSAASNILIMLGAIVMVHGRNGLFLPDGFEYNLALIGLFLPTLVAGPGRYSLSHMLPLPRSRRTGRVIAPLE